MPKSAIFNPVYFRFLVFFCVLIILINPVCATFIESIQTRRTRVELIVADQILEGKKSKK